MITFPGMCHRVALVILANQTDKSSHLSRRIHHTSIWRRNGRARLQKTTIWATQKMERSLVHWYSLVFAPPDMVAYYHLAHVSALLGQFDMVSCQICSYCHYHLERSDFFFPRTCGSDKHSAEENCRRGRE